MNSHLLHSAEIKRMKWSKRLNPNYLYLKNVYFTTKKRIEFYRMLNTLTSNGVSIQSALTLIKSKFVQIKKANDPMNKIISDILFTMHTGFSFHQALAKWIPNQEYVLISSSHQNIPLALNIVIQHSEHTLSIKSTLTASLSYPVMMFILLILTMTAMSFYIMPNMAKLTPVSKWPPMSYKLYLLCDFITAHYITISGLLVITVFFVIWSLPNLSILGIRSLLDYLPPWNIYKAYTATSFLVAISSIVKLGSSFNSAILTLEPISSSYLRRYLKIIKNKLISGSGFGDAIDIGIFDGITLVSLSVFAVTNRLEQGIQYISDNNLEEQKKIILQRGKLLGYCMMAFVAVMIGWVVLSMYGMQSAVST